jgi:hypothetical protein
MSNNAQSGRAAAIARRKAQVKGKGGQSSASTATRQRPSSPEPVATTAAPAPTPVASKPSRSRRQVSAAAPTPASAAGREAAKQKRQQQKHGKSAADAAKSTSRPGQKAKAKQKPEEPIVEPRQSKTPKPAARSERRKAVKPEVAVQPSGRLQSKAYRQAQAKGKAGQEAFKSKGTSQSGAKAKLANPDASTREIAKQVRAEKCAKGKTCSTGGSRPMRQPRNSESLPQKVGESQTLSGQAVSGTQVGQGEKKMTGAETGACQLVSGTEYLGSEEFHTNCGSQPEAKPAKVTQTQTTRGQSVSGTEVGRAEKMTGNETGTCSSITGTEYLPADQSQMYCSATPAKAKATGFSVMSQPAQKSGEKITGGDNRRSQSTTIKPKTPAKAPQKVMPSQTAKGNTTTGTQVGRLQAVTGGEAGTCKSVTGTGYQSAEEAETLCQMPATDTATKVTASGTSLGQKVTGERSGAYYGMTGAETGDCQAVTGTPYTGAEQTQLCSVDQQTEIKVRQRQGANPSISGVQPGPQGLTGAQKGACELVSGTHYQGMDQTAMVCDSNNAAAPGESDFPMMLGQAQAAPVAMAEPAPEQGSRITGDGWDRGSKVTGTDGPWAAQRNASVRGTAKQSPMAAAQFTPGANAEVPMSPITGSSGNTDTGAKVTLSGGARA